MIDTSSTERETVARKTRGQKAQKNHALSPLRKQQQDGSEITSPPQDPVNSDETLRRNDIGNS